MNDMLPTYQFNRSSEFNNALLLAAFGSLPRNVSQSIARGVTLPTTSATARTQRAIRFDDHVSDFASETISSTNQLTAGDNAPAVSRSEGNNNDILTTHCRTSGPFGDCGTGGIVIHPNLGPQSLTQ